MIEPSDTSEMTELPVADPGVELPAPNEAPERISQAVRLAVLVVILVPLLAVLAAPFITWGWGFRWADLGLLLSLYVLTALGITVGYHRLFVHRSFETNIVVKFILAVLGSMAVQGPLLKWVAMHRRHHQHADTAGDPHSPHGHDGGILGVLRGAWHAHLGWLFDPEPPDLDRYVPDLKRSRALRVAIALFPAWVALGLLIPAALGGDHGDVGGRMDGADLGWAGPHLPRPSRDPERQLRLPPLGIAALPEP